jgi:hypothetical protein
MRRILASWCCCLALHGSVLKAEEEIVVGDDVGVVSDETSALSGWCLLECPQRTVDGRTVFVRQSAEAFEDPDARQGLEPKYFFKLAEDLSPPRENLSRPNDAHKLAALSLPDGRRFDFAPATDDDLEENPAAEAEWIDWRAKPSAKSLATLWIDDQQQAHLQVLEADPDQPGVIRKVLAERSFPASELVLPHQKGGLLDTCDRPELRPREATFFGRVIALLKQVDGRYVVDLYGEKLHEDSDCRVQLTPAEHPWGRPIAVQFAEIPVRRGDGRIADVSVLAVTYRNDDGSLRHVGVEFPLCNTIALSQLRKMSALIPKNASAQAKPGPDVRKLLGPDVAEELERRLVDGHYR